MLNWKKSAKIKLNNKAKKIVQHSYTYKHLLSDVREQHEGAGAFSNNATLI